MALVSGRKRRRGRETNLCHLFRLLRAFSSILIPAVFIQPCVLGEVKKIRKRVRSFFLFFLYPFINVGAQLSKEKKNFESLECKTSSFPARSF